MIPMYLLRYYDYDYETGKTIGIYSTPDRLFATIVDKYLGQVDISKIELPGEIIRCRGVIYCINRQAQYVLFLMQPAPPAQ